MSNKKGKGTMRELAPGKWRLGGNMGRGDDDKYKRKSMIFYGTEEEARIALAIFNNEGDKPFYESENARILLFSYTDPGSIANKNNRGYMCEVKNRPGTWSFRVYVGRGDDGKYKRKSMTFHGTKEEAEKELQNFVKTAQEEKNKNFTFDTVWKLEVFTERKSLEEKKKHTCSKIFRGTLEEAKTALKEFEEIVHTKNGGMVYDSVEELCNLYIAHVDKLMEYGIRHKNSMDNHGG